MYCTIWSKTHLLCVIMSQQFPQLELRHKPIIVIRWAILWFCPCVMYCHLINSCKICRSQSMKLSSCRMEAYKQQTWFSGASIRSSWRTKLDERTRQSAETFVIYCLNKRLLMAPRCRKYHMEMLIESALRYQYYDISVSVIDRLKVIVSVFRHKRRIIVSFLSGRWNLHDIVWS